MPGHPRLRKPIAKNQTLRRLRLRLTLLLPLTLLTLPLAAQNSSHRPYQGTVQDEIQLPSDGIIRTHAGELHFDDSPFSDLNEDRSSAAVIADSKTEERSAESIPLRPRPNLARTIFRKHRWDFSIEGARLHNNIPFVFDFLLGDGYNMTGVDYTLAPFIFSMRWQLSGIHGYKMFRGTWEGSFSGTYTMIPRGPETRYFAYIMGIRRNFVQTNWKVFPYVEYRLGAGDINAKGPVGAYGAQGQDFTFTMIMDSGFRYAISDRYSMFFGASYMHVSNLYLSEPKYLNYGINVYGPMMGIDMRIGRHREPTVH